MTDVQAAEEDVAVNQQQHALTDDGDTPPIGSNDNGLGTEAKAMASAKAIERTSVAAIGGGQEHLNVKPAHSSAN